jgi:hypothetical protein
MAKLTITIELTSMAQADAIQSALEMYVDMEIERSKDNPKDTGWDATAAARLLGAKQILATLSPPAPRKIGQ